MESETTRRDLQSLLESIRSSDNLESRLSLISHLGDCYRNDTSDLAILIEWLVTFWEEPACCSSSNCILNKALLCLATKLLESNISDCLGHFLNLGTKASIWCRRHLQVMAVSIEESRDETSDLSSQLILDILSVSTAIMSTLTQAPRGKVLMPSIKNFTCELLNLTNALLCSIKRIHSIASDVLKGAQVILDSAIKLCRAYFQSISEECFPMMVDRNEGCEGDEGMDYAGHIVNMTTCTIECLYEVGTFAASAGGNLVTVLNISWKGIVCLLQLHKEVLAEKINVGGIILTLVSLSSETLRCAAESWFSRPKESLTISEAKRTFLPIKFYLINAVRISSEYSSKAVMVYREICRCVLLITSLVILSCEATHLKAVSEALTEFLEPTSFLLLHTLLNSAEVSFESKAQILEWLFANGTDSSSADVEQRVDSSADITMTCNGILNSGVLKLGRFVLFVNLLKSSSTMKEEMVHEVSMKLDILMNALIQEDIYSAVLELHIPVLSSSGALPGVTWQPMYSCIIHSLKAFLVVASLYKFAWVEVETFLFHNLLHPHFLCSEIVRELWSFIMRHAEIHVIHHVMERLCRMFKMIASSEPSLSPVSSLRNMARSICCLLTSAPTAAVDRVYTFTVCEEKMHLSSTMLNAMLLEGFPLGSLSDTLKMTAVRKIVTAFKGFLQSSNFNEFRLHSYSGSLDLPVHALSSLLHSCKIENSEVINDVDISQTLKFTTSLTCGLRNATDDVKDHHAKLLAAMLIVLPDIKQLNNTCAKMRELILELQTLFAGQSESDAKLYQCKPSLASFMVSISGMEIAEGEESSELYSAILSLHHVLLKERHWAFNHLSVSAFASFAASTSCSQLWKFVPVDAALSFDTETGEKASEERFMAELKAFLEKEAALLEATSSCKDQRHLLLNEGMLLLCKLNSVPSRVEDDASEAGNMVTTDDAGVKHKKRKLPNGVCEGMELLHCGLRAMNNALNQDEAAELKDVFFPHISCLEDVISHLVRLSENL